MIRAVAVQKSRTVIEVGRQPTPPGHARGQSRAQGVALIVIKIEEAFIRRREVCQAAGDAAAAFNRLMGIGKVKIQTSEDMGRAHGALESANAHVIDRERKENV